MAGLRVGILGAGGVGIATAGALIQQGLVGRLTIYDRTAERAEGEALDYLHALPLLPNAEIRGLGIDSIEPEDVLVVTVGHHTKPGESRLDTLEHNIEVMASTAEAIERGGLPRIVIVVSNPLDVLTEYLTRRWVGQPVSVMGSGTSLDTLRFTERIAEECGVHPRSVHAWVVGEHGDSAVFLFDAVTDRRAPVALVCEPAWSGCRCRVVCRSRAGSQELRVPRARAEGLHPPRHRPRGEWAHPVHRTGVGHHHPGVGARRR